MWLRSGDCAALQLGYRCVHSYLSEWCFFLTCSSLKLIQSHFSFFFFFFLILVGKKKEGKQSIFLFYFFLGNERTWMRSEIVRCSLYKLGQIFFLEEAWIWKPLFWRSLDNYEPRKKSKMMHPFNNYKQNTFNKTVAMVIENSYIKTKPNNSSQILQKLIFLFPNQGYLGDSKVTC